MIFLMYCIVTLRQGLSWAWTHHSPRMIGWLPMSFRDLPIPTPQHEITNTHHHALSLWLKLRSSCVLYLNCLPFPTINSPFFRWLGQRLPGSPIVKLPFLFCACWKQVTNHSPNLKSEIWCTNSLRRSRPELFRVSLHRRLVSSPLLIYLLEHLFMSA